MPASRPRIAPNTLGGATGGNFILGQANSADATSSLSAPVAGTSLQVTNTSTDSTAVALNVRGSSVSNAAARFVNSGTGSGAYASGSVGLRADSTTNVGLWGRFTRTTGA